jgi:hypothetical protein
MRTTITISADVDVDIDEVIGNLSLTEKHELYDDLVDELNIDTDRNDSDLDIDCVVDQIFAGETSYMDQELMTALMEIWRSRDLLNSYQREIVLQIPKQSYV